MPNSVPFQISVRLFENCPSTAMCFLHKTGHFSIHVSLGKKFTQKMRSENNVTNLNEIFTVYFEADLECFRNIFVQNKPILMEKMKVKKGFNQKVPRGRTCLVVESFFLCLSVVHDVQSWRDIT